MSHENLKKQSKAQLIQLIEKLSEENAALKEIHSFMDATTKRLVKIEREQNKALQYSRRDSIEISGIPPTVSQDVLEDEVVKNFEKAKVEVHGKKLEAPDIQACHRVGKKGKTIVKFISRKYAREGLVCGKNLKNSNLYGNAGVYINTSFCPEFGHLNFLIRKAKADGALFRWKVRNGINFVQVEEEDEFVEISHINDLVELKLAEAEAE